MVTAQVTSEPYEMRADGGRRRDAAGRRIYRHVNERIRELWCSYATAEPAQLFCECSTRDCTATVVMDPARFDDVRRLERRFVVAPGHAAPGEAVVRRCPEYWLVEEQP